MTLRNRLENDLTCLIDLLPEDEVSWRAAIALALAQEVGLDLNGLQPGIRANRSPSTAKRVFLLSVEHGIFLRSKFTLITIEELWVVSWHGYRGILIRDGSLIDADNVAVVVTNVTSHSIHALQGVNEIIVHVLWVAEVRCRLLIQHRMVLTLDHTEQIVAARR